MKIISIQSGTFPEIERLNRNFRKEYQKLKITLDTLSGREFYLKRFPNLMFSIIEMLPNLRHHRCSHGENIHISREYDPSHLISPIKILGDVIDTVHLLEHTILELQCQISEMEICSGLTCNYWEPENRYDVFVECTEPNLAAFSTELSVALFNHLLYAPNEQFPDIKDIIRLARTVYKHELRSIRQISTLLNWSEEKVIEGMERLEQFKFPFRVLQPAA